MHLRRAVLLLGLVIGLAAITAALSPSPRTDVQPGPATAPPPATPPAAPTARVALNLDGTRRRTRTVPPGAHLILSVEVPEPGQVQLMGTVQPAEPGTPAQFDLIAPQSGSYTVRFTPSAAGPDRGATIRVRKRAAP